MKNQIGIIIVVVLLGISWQSCKTLNATVDSTNYCSVHNQKMKKTRAFIKYGLRDMKNVSTDLLEYPNPKSNHYGGCSVDKDRARIYKYYYCTECNKAKKKEKRKKKHEKHNIL